MADKTEGYWNVKVLLLLSHYYYDWNLEGPFQKYEIKDDSTGILKRLKKFSCL